MIIETILFILLSPGLIITLPLYTKNGFLSYRTNTIAVFIHAIVFMILLILINRFSLFNGIEGFQLTRESLLNTDSAELENYAKNIKNLMKSENEKLSKTVKDLQDQIKKAQQDARNETAKFNQSLNVINRILNERRTRPVQTQRVPPPSNTPTPAGTTTLPSLV